LNLVETQRTEAKQKEDNCRCTLWLSCDRWYDIVAIVQDRQHVHQTIACIAHAATSSWQWGMFTMSFTFICCCAVFLLPA
jgi:hypothetical protein